MKYPLKAGQSGFSLIELMIVVGIIGILSTLAIPRFQQFQAKAKMGEARNMLSHIYTLQQSYHLDNNTYVNFSEYGRLATAAVNCTTPTTAPAGAKLIGFQISPCTGDAAPVPRYRYQVTGADRTVFVAAAISGAANNNLICSGGGEHQFLVNQNKVFSELPAGNALSACFN